MKGKVGESKVASTTHANRKECVCGGGDGLRRLQGYPHVCTETGTHLRVAGRLESQ
jgi:hypothetical protein